MLLTILFSVFIGQNSLAEWKPALVARAHLSEKGYNLPANSSLHNANAKINNLGDIAVKLSALEGEAKQAIWIKKSQAKNGEIIFTNKANHFLNDPDLNDNGQVLFHSFNEVESQGLIQYDINSKTIKNLITPKELPGAIYFAFGQINDVDQVVFRALFDDGHRELIQWQEGETKIIVSDQNQLSYLFTPELNNFGNVALKVRLGPGREETQRDEIRIYDSFGGYLVVIQDEPPYTRFQNSLAYGSNGSLALVSHNLDGKKQILLVAHGKIQILAEEGVEPISAIESFKPNINGFNEVTFRAVDSQGNRSLFVYSGHKLHKLAGEGDLLPCDKTVKCFVSSLKGYPGLVGSPQINDFGEVVAAFYLISADTKKYLGTGLYLFNP